MSAQEVWVLVIEHKGYPMTTVWDSQSGAWNHVVAFVKQQWSSDPWYELNCGPIEDFSEEHLVDTFFDGNEDFEWSLESHPIIQTRSSWEENPDHPVSDWKYEVANDDCRVGYLDWVASQMQEANHEPL